MKLDDFMKWIHLASDPSRVPKNLRETILKETAATFRKAAKSHLGTEELSQALESVLESIEQNRFFANGEAIETLATQCGVEIPINEAEVCDG